MARTDYYDDPAAPRPNSMVVAASAVVPDERGRILLVERADSGDWALPGGGMEVGETIIDCVVREVREETGLEVEAFGLIGIYTDPRHVIAYADGEIRQQFNVCFRARALGGTLRASEESDAVRFTEVGALDQLPIHPTQRLRIDHYLEHRQTPYLG